MEKEPELIANIDLDGTVADFDKAIVAALNRMRSPSEPEFTGESLNHSPEWLEERMFYIKYTPGFWQNLEPIPLGMEVLDLIRQAGYTLNILTKGPNVKRRGPHVFVSPAWSEKVHWVHNYVPDAQVTITQDKGLSYGKVLFDDWPPYIKRWLEWRPRGLVLMLDSMNNRDFQHPNVVRIRDRSDFARVTWSLYRRARNLTFTEEEFVASTQKL